MGWRRERLLAAALFAVSLVFFVFVFYKTNQVPFETILPLGVRDAIFPPVRSDPSAPITILMWDGEDGYHPNHNWAGFGNGELLRVPNYVGHEVKRKCRLPCTFTNDKRLLGSANAVLFEAQPKNPENLWDWLREPIQLPQKRPGQLWVNFGYQHQHSFPLLGHDRYMQQFDVNMTFDQRDLSHNVPISLFCYWGGETDLTKPPPIKNDDKLVIFISNNCGIGGAKSRAIYVEELMKYITVDSFGACLHNKNLPDDMTSLSEEDHGSYMKKLIKLIGEYKFMLAFENDNLTDFVTEKLMLALQAGTVPVYMGAPNVDSWLPGEKSIIKTDSFASPKDLATSLKKLSEENFKYNEFFNWKKKIAPQFLKMIDKCALYDAECRLCEKVAEIQRKMPDTAKGNDVIMDRSFALMFDGNTHVEIGNFPELQLSDSYTITTWIHVKEMNDYRIVDKGTEGRVDGYSFDVLRKGSRSFIRLCAALNCNMGMKPLSDGNWYHVAVVFLSGKGAAALNENWCGVKFYVDGEHDYTAEYPVALYSLGSTDKNQLPLRIGRAGEGGAFFKGLMDDVSIWNLPLSMAKIRQLMFQRLGGNEPGLLVYYSFNEGEGNTVHDYGKRKRHGSIVGNNIRWIPSEEKEVILNTCL